MAGTNLGPFTNNFNPTGFQTNPNSFVNPYYSQGAGEAGSNTNLNNLQQAGLGIQGEGLGTTAGGVAGEQGIANYETGIVNGTQPSLAQSQLAQNTSQNIGNQMALAAAARGGNPALAGYNAAANAGATNQTAAGQAATAGIAEREGAANIAGGLEGAIAGQGLTQAQLGTQQGEYATGANIGQQQFGTQAQENEQSLQEQSDVSQNNLLASIAGQNATNATNVLGSAIKAGAAFASQGGVIPQSLAVGGMVHPQPIPHAMALKHFAQGGFAGSSNDATIHLQLDPVNMGAQPSLNGTQASSSPSENATLPSLQNFFAGGGGGLAGGAGAAAGGFAQGGSVVVPGEPSATDTTPAMLRPGELVISPEMPEYGAILAHMNATRGSNSSHHLRGAQRIVSSMMKE